MRLVGMGPLGPFFLALYVRGGGVAVDVSAARLVMSADDLRRALRRIAHEIVERNQGASNLVFLGVPRPGPVLASRLAKAVAEFEGVDVLTGAIDISLYRDDLKQRVPTPDIYPTEIPDDVNDKDVVLVDDVLYTGRSARAALDALTDFGRPRSIQLAVVVDRGHRELPIRADYVGMNIPTAPNESVEVSLAEIVGEDAVRIVVDRPCEETNATAS